MARSFVIILSLLTLTTPILSAPAKDDCYKTVQLGQSIQAALNKAKKGDIITVENGTYAEYLEITTSGITVVGKPGATLTPPPPGTPPPVGSPCYGLSEFNGTKLDTGICIHGKDVQLKNYEAEHRRFINVSEPVSNVVVTGLTVQNFAGINIAVVGGCNVRVKENNLREAGQYGFLAVGSTDTLAEKNTISAATLSFIAMCMDDLSGAQFKANTLSGYFIALCTQTQRGLVKKNTVTNCCIGPFVDPGIVGARILDNTISDRNPACPAGPGGAGAGVVINGGRDTEVKGNKITNIKSEGAGVGVFISDTPGQAAMGNVIKRNTFKGNNLDVFSVAAGPNTIEGNNCEAGPDGDMCQ